ncbi:hypothetical protein PTKIN_Ptkin13bG0130200 [Pterospermum kingtungense]
MESSAHEGISSEDLPSAWEDKAASPRPHAPYVQGINIPPSPQTLSEYFQDTLSTSLPQDPMDFMMFQLATFSHVETTDYIGSLPTDPLASQQQLDHNITSFSMELAMSSGTEKLLPTGPVATQRISSSVSVAAAAVDASSSQVPAQQSKPLSRHQIYRMNVKGKAKFKNLSHLVLNEHIKMLNEELLRKTDELKTKDEQLSHLLSENQMLKEENKRLKLPSSSVKIL